MRIVRLFPAPEKYILHSLVEQVTLYKTWYATMRPNSALLRFIYEHSDNSPYFGVSFHIEIFAYSTTNEVQEIHSRISFSCSILWYNNIDNSPLTWIWYPQMNTSAPISDVYFMNFRKQDREELLSPMWGYRLCSTRIQYRNSI